MNKEELLYQIATLQQENKQLKEEIKQYQKELEEDVDKKEMEEYIIYWQKQCDELQERIDKAIERLKKIQDNAIKYGANHDANICYELIEILKGDSNE